MAPSDAILFQEGVSVKLRLPQLSSGEYLPGSLQDKILSDDCLEKEQMVVSAIASTPQSVVTLVWGISPRQPSGKNIIRWLCLKKEQMVVVRYCQYTSNVSSVETKYQKLREELNKARENIPPRNPVDADKLLAASRGEFVEGISDPTDPKWIKGIQARDTEDQNQSKVEQIAPEAGQNSPDTQQNGPEEQQPAPVAQPELEKNCRVCGQTGGGNCPDCSAVMGDSTYTETFGENDAADGEDSAQTEEKIIQENSVDAAQEGETVVQNEPGSDTSGDDANSEPVTLDWKRQLVIAAVYGLCANPACIATAPAIPDIAIMIANRLENFGGDKS
ncbi:Exodeoxyribonuclease VIII [Shigella dysenteriae 1617]|uniref:Exodeoxyribonuclease VIII n=1 Tax=Shigella dysenteriae 1617 TaxID=754093 RepID=A0A0A6ZRT4_SHIDY|nr:Exodeoxyribonuclease VIII [Shigella dysenteriae 1617]